ncbi:MAG: hypothetical protein GY715_16830, partial [Planctomycetes bacterium]|nr:hypothetical protein [Planctomycetota bacterium]
MRAISDAAERDLPPAPPPLAIDTRSFEASIWNPPPPPAKPQRQSNQRRSRSKPKPMPLQLVGITHRDGELFAVLYDSDQDRIATLAEGTSYGGREIALVA